MILISNQLFNGRSTRAEQSIESVSSIDRLLFGRVKLKRDLKAGNIPIPRKKIKFAETMAFVYQTEFGTLVQGKLFLLQAQPKWLLCSYHSTWPFNPVFLLERSLHGNKF